MRFFTFVALTLSLAAAAVTAGDVPTNAGTALGRRSNAQFASSHQHMRMHRQVIKRVPSPLAAPALSKKAVSELETVERRQTQDQLDAAAKLQAENDEFHRKNSVWQAAVLADLKEGKTPLDFDAFWAAQQGGQGQSEKAAAASAAVADEDDGEDDDGDDDDDADDDDGEDDDDDDDDDADEEDDDDEDVTDSTTSAVKASPSTQVTPISSTDSTKPTAVIAPVSKGDKKGGHKGKGQTKAHGHGQGNGNGNGNGSGSGSGSILSGQGTWYNMAGGYTACGQMYSDSDMVAALSWELFDTKTPSSGNPNQNGFCGKKLRATYQGKSITVTAVDRCAGCKYGDLDFTPAAFSQLADVGVGRLNGIEWHWL